MWRDWCAKSPEFNENGLRTQWRSFGRTRESSTKKITFRTIYRYAKTFGWRDPDEEQKTEVEPTYGDDAATSAASARAELEQLIEAFLEYQPNVWEKYVKVAPHLHEPNAWEKYARKARCVHAVQATTGVGKTRIAARVIARRIKTGRLTGPVGYSVPTHRLGEDIADLFRAEGITAEVWRGRKAHVSGKDGPTMCDDLAAVKIAEDMGAVIERACCRGKDPAGKIVTCPHYHTCAYQAQKARKPDVWIFAHQMLFRKNRTLDDISALFIDESFRDAGTTKPVKGLTIDEIEAAPPDAGELEVYRALLAHSLRKQPHVGGVPLCNIHTGLDVNACTRAIQLEWKGKGKQALWPGMPAKDRAAAAEAGTNTRHIRTLDRVWRAVRELVQFEGDVVSGRLFMANHKTENGIVRVVRTRGIRKVASQYDAVKTFIMDATLPAKSILEKWFPEVEIVGQIEAPMPHVRVRQILGSPITKKKLAGAGRNLRAVRRYILRRHVEAGRGTVLVIAQKDIEAALRATGLPPTIAVEHFNAIEGLDQYKNVRLLITVGRTQPEPAAVEADAGALSGVEPVKAAVRANRSTWFDRVTRGVRMRDGRGVAVSCDQHPDGLAEAIRQQICEAELVQAIGRGRGVNRTAETTLDVDILADVVLPVTVDRVDGWRPPGLEVEMFAEGVWLESPADMARAWPDVWATAQAAKDWLRTHHTVEFPLIVYVYQGKLHRVRYQHPGARQKWRLAWVDPAAVRDARPWLEARLGPLSGYEVVTVLILMRADDHAVASLDFATPAITVHPGPMQEKLPWFAPAVEEVFLTPEEVSALWTLPPIIEGSTCCPGLP